MGFFKVVQGHLVGYHRFRFEESRFSSKDLLDHLPPPVVPVIRHPPPVDRDSSAGRSSGKNSRRGRDRGSGSRQHHKATAGNGEKQAFLQER
ncbi:hypothetical protein Peur_029321 [Populus x canadensis]